MARGRDVRTEAAPRRALLFLWPKGNVKRAGGQMEGEMVLGWFLIISGKNENFSS